jgi:hypothetical protein
MKKYISMIAILLCLCLAACGNASSDSSEVDLDNLSDTPTTSPTQPKFDSFSFDSPSEFVTFLSKDTELYIALSEDGVNSEIIDTVKVFLKKLAVNKDYIPLQNGKTMEYGDAKISFYIREAYDQPCIFYHPYVTTGENFYIKTTYVPDHIAEELEDPTASEVIKELTPNGANLNNLGKQHKAIYNQKIQLADREVTALVFEFKTDSRNSYRFVYDDLLVEVRCNPEVWDAKWFATLSFGSID